MTPRRGELIVFDKLARPLVRRRSCPCRRRRPRACWSRRRCSATSSSARPPRTSTDKHGDRDDRGGLANLLRKGGASCPALLDEEVTATYAGLRAATEHGDYQIALHPDARYVCVGGIRSTGLTASMAIAEHVAEVLADAGLA